MKNSELTPFDDLTESQEADLIRQVNDLFLIEYLLPRKQTIIDYLTNVVRGKEGFKLLKEPATLEVIDLVYPPYAALTYLSAMPCSEFYADEHWNDLPTISMENYNYDVGRGLFQRILETNNIDFTELLEDVNDPDSIDYGDLWDRHEAEVAFMMDCWKLVKERTETTIKCFFVSGDGGIAPIDLDNGVFLDDIEHVNPIQPYLATLGIHPSVIHSKPSILTRLKTFFSFSD